jgi:hypothetical protein
MIRLAVICLPFLAMACASVPEPVNIDEIPAFESVPAPLAAGSCGDRRWERHEAWQEGLPNGVTLGAINEALYQSEERKLGCDEVVFAVRSHSPLEIWVMCERDTDTSFNTYTSFNTENSEVSDLMLNFTGCDARR